MRITCNNTVISRARRIVIENPNLIDQVYSGKPGCCCGCLGKYSESAAGIKAHVTRTNALFASGEVTDIDIDAEEGVFIETDTRYRNIYIRKDEAIITQCGSLIIISARTSGSAFIQRAVASHATA